MKRLVVTMVIASTGVAFADDLVLHSADSITIEGTRYSCEDASRHGVHLALGDKVTAGKYHLRCVGSGDDDEHGHDRPPPELVVTSEVDQACIDGMNMAVSGRPSAVDALRWAEACRPVEIGHRCTTTTTRPDDGCFGQLRLVLAGNVSDTDVPQIQRACQRIEARCPALPTKATSRVDLDCLNKLYSNAKGKPSGRAVIGWIDSCRDRRVGGCIVIGGSLDAGCLSQTYSVVSSKLTPSEIVEVTRACRTVDLVCD